MEKENEKIYQTWGKFDLISLPFEKMHITTSPPPPSVDCPQVQAVFDYKAKQPDELDLQRGDVVKVYRKMADGKSTIIFNKTCTLCQFL